MAKTAPTIPAGFTVAPAPSPPIRPPKCSRRARRRSSPLPSGSSSLPAATRRPATRYGPRSRASRCNWWPSSIEAGRDSLKLAGSADDIDANKADITLNLKEPLAAARVPKARTQLTIQGVPSEYTAVGDTFNLTFADGEVSEGVARAFEKASRHRPTKLRNPGRKETNEGRRTCRPFFIRVLKPAGLILARTLLPLQAAWLRKVSAASAQSFSPSQKPFHSWVDAAFRRARRARPVPAP